ncbi:hypothetical protein [Methylobacterium fujisawaense]
MTIWELSENVGTAAGYMFPAELMHEIGRELVEINIDIDSKICVTREYLLKILPLSGKNFDVDHLDKTHEILKFANLWGNYQSYFSNIEISMALKLFNALYSGPIEDNISARSIYNLTVSYMRRWETVMAHHGNF